MIALLVAAALGASPLDLAADSLELSPTRREAVAEGHVHAASAELDLTCENAKATYGEPDSAGKREIVRLEVSGTVHATRKLDGLVVDAETATWDRAAGSLVLVGDPVVRRGADVLKGAKMTLFTTSDGLDVELPSVTLLRRPKEPARIGAARLTVQNGGQKAVFEHNVHLKQGDYQATSDRLEALLDGAGGKPSKIEHLDLSGKVALSRGEVRASAERADFDASTGDLVLEGDPRLDSGGDRLEGERIVYNGETGKARVEKATARVRGPR